MNINKEKRFNELRRHYSYGQNQRSDALWWWKGYLLYATAHAAYLHL